MISVSNKTKELFKADSTYKEMVVTIYDTNDTVFTNDDIYYESFELSESILDGSTMTFMGCIASEMRITLRNKDNFRETAFNDCKVEVDVTPYEEVQTKNKMPALYLAGNIDTVNGVVYAVNDDLSISVVGTAQIEVEEGVYEPADSSFEIAHFVVLEGQTLILSGCLTGAGSSGVKCGIFTVKAADGTVTTYEDTGNDIQITFNDGDECSYTIFVKGGETVNMLYQPMLRATSESRSYVHYGYDLVAADTVRLFTGYIDSGEYANEKSYIKITAYDVFYKLNSFNVWNWYRTAFGNNGNRSFATLLTSFSEYVDTNSGYDFELSSTKCPVILEDFLIKKRLKSKEMTATNFLKSFCQLSCGMAMMGRNGEMKMLYLDGDMANEDVTYYRSFTSKDYIIKPFENGITIRTNSDDKGVTLFESTADVTTMPTASASNLGKVYHYVGTTTSSYTYDSWYECQEDNGTYSWVKIEWDSDSGDDYVVDDDDQLLETGLYFIENNGLVKNLNKGKRKSIIDVLLRKVQTDYYTFKSYELQCNGLPYLECGDSVTYTVGGEPIEGEFDGYWDEDTDATTGADTVATVFENTYSSDIPMTVELTITSTITNSYIKGQIGILNTTTGGDPTRSVDYYDTCFRINATTLGSWISDNRPGNSSSLVANDKLTFYNYGGELVIKLIKYNSGSPIEYDLSDVEDIIAYMTYIHEGQTDYIYANADIYAKAYVTNNFYGITYGSNRFTKSRVSMKMSYSTNTGTRIKMPILNRKLKGIQSMVDTFSFELPNTTKTYGGSTSGIVDENIASESSTTSEKLAGTTVMIVENFDSQTGVLTTSSKTI